MDVTMQTKVKRRKVLVSMPEPLLKKLDDAAEAEQRTRTAELCLRLGATFVKPVAAKAARGARP